MFDILPLCGELDPGASAGIHFSFYGHSDITADVVAACKVEGGPTYELQLSGEASKMDYEFSNRTLEFGAILYDQVQCTEVVLYNRGKVTFDFVTLNVKEDVHGIASGEIGVSPSRGQINAGDNITFTVTFLPGNPETFSKCFEIEVAHFEADVITLTGEAIYPSMTLNLPRDISAVASEILDEARTQLEKDTNNGSSEIAVSTEYSFPESLEAEVDRLLVKQFAIKHADKINIKPKPR